MYQGIDYAKGKDKTVYHGVLFQPLKIDNMDYSNANITDSITDKSFDGLTINYVEKFGDCLKISYTVDDPNIIEKMKHPRVSCGMRENNE